jgi:NAD(P) transhydrogenase subunit alpha
MLSPLLIGLYVFVLAIFVGRELLTKVPHTLHTPLMSGANAISGITIVGAITCASYLVTDRMLKKFQKKG